jgi:hypothetical protein
MKFFYAVNLTERTLHTGMQPWEFVQTEEITAQIRGDKTSRQEWYANTATKHYFYTLIEAANPNQRPSKDNPPKYLHGLAADYDIAIPPERITEAIKAMKVKPAYVERSIGGNARLVWLFKQPLAVDTCEFCSYVMTEAIKWLNLGLLPALDEPAFVAFSRLLCNGCQWQSTGHGPVPDNELQAFFVKCGRDFRFQPEANATDIPLDIVEKALLEKFPNLFSWPTDFQVDSQGPSFWVEGSTSPMSAIVKKEGMFTFSGHAPKPFYTWGEILGKDFVAKFTTDSIARATAEIYWDSKKFWKKKGGIYVSLEMPELSNYFKVQCRLSAKPGKDGTSAVDAALDHIYNTGYVRGGASFIFRPGGLLDFNGKKIINTWVNQVMQPAEIITPWGPEGKFPFLSMFLENLFDPAAQLAFFLAWWKHFYTAAYTLLPMPGQNSFLMGPPGAGKTLLNRAVVGRSVGGFMDASDYLIHSGGFNSEMFEVALWSVDDETVGESSAKQALFHAMLKKTSANQQFKAHKKFEIPMLTEWMGRVIVTSNMDYISSRALGPMDNSSMDKTNIFRCAGSPKIIFPKRHQLSVIIDTELPYLLRWLLSWEPPEYVVRDTRYGFAAYHEPTLLEQAQHSGRGSSFKELLIEQLQGWFAANPAATAWKGTLVQLQRMLIDNPQNEFVMRSLRLEQTARYLETIQREGTLKCSVENGPLKTRIWVFYRFGNTEPSPELPLPPNPQTNQFNKYESEQGTPGLRSPFDGTPPDQLNQ